MVVLSRCFLVYRKRKAQLDMYVKCHAGCKHCCYTIRLFGLENASCPKSHTGVVFTIAVLFNVNAGWRRVLFVEALCKKHTRDQRFYLSAVSFGW